MGYTVDKKLVWTKNKFETYLNSLTASQFNENCTTTEEEIKKATIIHENKGSFMRKKYKEEFDRLYICWLNVK